MRSFVFLATAFVSALSCSPGRCEPQLGAKVVFEDEVRSASDRLYSDILSRACRNGWRYSRASIENGFERHFREMKAELGDAGYLILPRSPAAFPVDVARRSTGCSGPYWLSD